jgi:hypothetical protein
LYALDRSPIVTGFGLPRESSRRRAQHGRGDTPGLRSINPAFGLSHEAADLLRVSSVSTRPSSDGPDRRRMTAVTYRSVGRSVGRSAGGELTASLLMVIA